MGLLVQVGHASETVTYTYDALGRLISSSNSGGFNNGLQTNVIYDPAGNRSNYSVGGAPPPPTLSISNASVTEGGALVFTVTKSGNGAVSASWSTANGTASAGSDYTAANGTISFAVGETSKTISVTTIDDTAVEPAETLTVTLSSPSQGAAIGTATGTGTIDNNDVPPPSFAISNATSVTEGGTLVFTVTRTGTTTGSFSVNFSTANGSATAGSDYTELTGTLTFAAGETSKTISVATIDDGSVETAETVLVNLSGSTGGAPITTSQANGTISDNDVPAPSFAISNAAAVTEGGTLVFTVTRNGTATGTYSIAFAAANGTAAVGSDYSATSGTLTFAAGETSKTISVATVNDFVLESAETVLVNLTSATGGATITTGQASGTINDDDYPPPSFAISNAATVTEGGILVFTITKTGTTNTSYSVSFATANGSAAAGSDYTAASGTLTFTAGETSKTISVATVDDAAVESAESVLVNLSGATGGATITTTQASGTLRDNDYPPPTFSISNATSVTEGGTLVFTVIKTGTTNLSYSVNFAAANGSAVSGSDYTPNSGTLTFAPNETFKTISVATVSDFTLEAAEYVLVNLSAPSGGASISTGQASGTINDDDYPPPSFAITNAPAVNEGGTLVFTVVKSGITNTSYSVSFATANGTAAAGTDYASTSGTLTFAAHETSKTVSVATIDDSATEGAETVLVNLSSATGGATISTGQGSGTLNASDPNSPPIANADYVTVGQWAGASINVVANDSDSDGDYPLTLVSVDGSGGSAYASDGSHVVWLGGSPGTYLVQYTVRDSRNATTTGTLTVQVCQTSNCLDGPIE